jgi:hypothetical protein
VTAQRRFRFVVICDGRAKPIARNALSEQYDLARSCFRGDQHHVISQAS